VKDCYTVTWTEGTDFTGTNISTGYIAYPGSGNWTTNTTMSSDLNTSTADISVMVFQLSGTNDYSPIAS